MINFVIPRSYQSELDAIRRMRVGVDYPYWRGGQFNWAAQSYLVLREHREGMTLDVAPAAGRMNFAHSMVWRSCGPRQGEFRIGVRADYRRLHDVDIEILQNPVQVKGKRQIFLPYWPVPGMLPRDAARNDILNIAYAGRIGVKNLAQSVEHALQSHFPGVKFLIIPPDRWHDMREVDLLIAIRSLDHQTHDNKPASKLWNAWRAGIPLIAGWDSAFSAVGTPDQDYIRVASHEDLVRELARLRDDSGQYRAIVDAGRARVSAIEHRQLAEIWLEQMTKVVEPMFDRWQRGDMPGFPMLDRALDAGWRGAAKLRSAVR